MYKLGSKELELRQSWRGAYADGLHWYAIMVHTGREIRVRQFILEEVVDSLAPSQANPIAEVFLPIVQQQPSMSPLRNRQQPEKAFLFRSYLFLQCAMNDAIYTPICDHQFVYQILGRGYRIPSILEDEEIENLKKILRSDSRPELVSRRNIGSMVEITEGLMAGIRGRVVTANAREVKLEVGFSFLDGATGVVVSVPRINVKILERSSQPSARERVCYA